MKTFFKWTLRAALLLVAILVIAPLAATVLVDKDDLKAQLDQIVVDKTGRHLNVNGPIGLIPGLNLGLYAEDVEFENADWASRPAAVSARRLSAELSLPALIGGTVQIKEIVLDGVSMWLETGPDGQINLVAPSEAAPKEPGPVVLPDWVVLKEVRMTDSEIVVKGQNDDFVIDFERVVIESEGRKAPLQIDLSGALQQANLGITGTLGTLQSLFARASSEADLTLTLSDGGRANINGIVGDILAWKDVDFGIEAAMPSLQPLVPLIPSAPSILEQLEATGRLVQPGSVKNMALEELRGNLIVAGVALRAAGRIGKLTKAEELDFQITGEGSLAKSLLPDVLPEAVQPMVNVDVTLGGDARTPSLVINDARVSIEGALATASGKLANLLGDFEQPVVISVDIANSLALGDTLDIPLPALGSVAGSANLKRQNGSFGLDNIQIRNSDSAAEIVVNGVIDHLGSKTSGNLVAEARVNPDFFAASAIDLPIIPEPIVASATLTLDDQELSLSIDQAETTLPGTMISAKGNIPDLRTATDLSLDLVATVDELDALGGVFDVELPAVGATNVQATLSGSTGVWNLTNLTLDTDDDGLFLNAKGSLNELGQGLTADIVFEGSLTTDRLTELVPEIAESIEPIEGELRPIAVDGRLVASDAKNWSLQALNVGSKWLGADLQVMGGIDTFSPLSGNLDVALKGATENQSALLKDFPLPPLDAVDISLNIPLPIAENGVRDVQGQVLAGNATLAFSGDIRQLSPLSGEGFKLSLNAPDLSTLIEDDNTFKPGNAVRVDIDVALDPGAISAGGVIEIGRSHIDGSVNWVSREDQKPKLDAVITSRGVDLDSLLKNADPEQKAESENTSTGNLLSQESLVPSFAAKLDADIKIDIAALKTSKIQLDALKGAIALSEGGLSGDLSARNTDGAVEMELSLREGDENFVRTYLTNFPIDAIQSVAEEKVLIGGTVDFGLNITGPSSSVAGLLENGQGGIDLNIRDSRMASSALSLVGGDLLSNVVSAINPFAERSDTVGVECAVVRLKVGDGKIETSNGIAMKTDRVTLLGSGEVLLPSESIKLVIAPKARKGLGVNASSIAKMIRVGGTLAAPSIETDAKGLLKSGAAITAALASGGLSLFATGLLDRLKANSDVCAIARGDSERPENRKPVNEAGPK